MVKLSDISITSDEIINYLKKDIQLKDICQKILYQRIIDQAAQAKAITVTPDEIQEEGDRWRHELHLEKTSDTLAWLDNQMLTVEALEAGIRDRLLAKKLAKRLFEQDIEAAFMQHRLDFDQVLFYQIIVSDQTVAQELFFQIEEQEISFFEAAHLYHLDEGDRQKCGYEGRLYRWNLTPDISAAVFKAQPDELVGPLKTDRGYHLLLVKELIPAQLTPEIHQELLEGMFQSWLTNELNYLLHNKIAL